MKIIVLCLYGLNWGYSIVFYYIRMYENIFIMVHNVTVFFIYNCIIFITIIMCISYSVYSNIYLLSVMYYIVLYVYLWTYRKPVKRVYDFTKDKNKCIYDIFKCSLSTNRNCILFLSMYPRESFFYIRWNLYRLFYFP